MALKPSAKPSWTYTNPNLSTVSVEPSSGKKITGWEAAEKPPFQTMNWLFYNMSLWLDHVQVPEITPVTVTNAASPYTALVASPIILADTTSGNVQINLPAVAAAIGFEFYIVKIAAANSLILDGNGAETLNGDATKTYKLRYTILRCKSDGAGGYYVEEFVPKSEAMTSVTSNTTITAADNGKTFLMNSSSGVFNMTLPTPVEGLEFSFKDKGGALSTNAVTLVRAGSEKIEEVAASYPMESDYGFWKVKSDGTDWFFVM